MTAAESGPQRRSHLGLILNVPQRYACGVAIGWPLLDDRFEQPYFFDFMATSPVGWAGDESTHQSTDILRSCLIGDLSLA